MDRDIQERIEKLSPEKQRLLKALLDAEDRHAWSQAAYAPPTNDAEHALVVIWQTVLGVPRIGIHDNYFELGGDSIQCIQITSKARAAGIPITANLLFEHPTIEELAVHAMQARPANSVDHAAATPAVRHGDMPLLPAQRWFFEQRLANPHHWNQAIVMRTAPGLPPEILHEALQATIDHHDALRCRWRFGSDGGPASARIEPPGESIAWEAHACADASRPVSDLAFDIGPRLQGGLDITRGPIHRAALLDFGPERDGRLIVVSHHLAVDVVSYRILLEDVEAFARSRWRGESPVPFVRSASIIDVSTQLARAARTNDVHEELSFWLQQGREASPPPFDDPEADRTERCARTVQVVLDTRETESLIRLAPQMLRADIPELLLTALLRALSPWLSGDHVRIELEGHGRPSTADALDASRTVGWFTSLFPVRFALRRGSWRDTLTDVKETVGAVPQKGLGYGLLRYLSDAPDARALSNVPRPDIAFNYLGHFDHVLPPDAVLAPTDDDCGALYASENYRPYALQVVGHVRNGELRTNWIFGAGLFEETIRTLASRYVSELSQIAVALIDREVTHVSPSDFPDAGLTRAELDRIVTT